MSFEKAITVTSTIRATPNIVFAHRKKYCQNRDMAFALYHGVGSAGVQEGDHGPFRRPLETTGLQEEALGGPRSAPFGGRDGLV